MNLLSSLDLGTIIFISILFMISFISVMLHILLVRKFYEGFPYIIIGHVFALIGTVISLLLRGKVNDFVSIFMGNLFLLMYPLCYYMGLNMFHKISHAGREFALLLIVVFIGCFFIFRQENINDRVIIHSLIAAFLFILASVRPLLSDLPRPYKIQRFMSVAILPLGAFYLYRAIYTYQTMPNSNFQRFIQSDDLMKMLFLLSIFTAFMMFYCYLAMTGDRLTLELKEAKEREIEALQNQQKLFSIITHELKTPLTVINRSAQMIAHKLSKDDVEGAIQRLDTIKSNTIALLSLIEDCQDNAMLSSKGFSAEMSLVDLTDIIRESANNYTMITERAIRLDIKHPIPPCLCDPLLLRIVFNNIIDNAIKYSGHGSDIDISIATETENIIVTIVDKGIGIPEAEITNITDRFYRASNVNMYKGSGIGLHTTALILSLHKGEVEIKSALDKGTSVKVSIPCCHSLS